MTNMLSGESLIGGANVNSSMDLQSTGSLLEMSTLNVESSLSLNFKLSSGTITSIWIGLRKADKSDGRRTLCFQRLSKNVHKKHCNPTDCDGIPKRPTMYLNHMIQPEPEGSTQGYPLVSVEVLRYDKRSKSENIRIVSTEMELILEHTQQGIGHEVPVSAEGVEE
uniref:Uncharacterized protein n=1 Tax=Tanacetum cinerariifolium TaxID=118510 RepID=A0A699I197_TANCI|nr:hypothetical protein [Tanacetum cinerariifolium]